MMFLKKNIYICFFLSLMLFNKLFSLDPPSELIIKDLHKEQNNTEPSSDINDKLDVNYVGWIYDKTVKTKDYCEAKGTMFDSSIHEKFNHVKPFRFDLGAGLVIAGWEIGLKNMRIKDKRCLVIPSSLAYGNRRIGNIIEPNSTLLFEVELLNLMKVEDNFTVVWMLDRNWEFILGKKYANSSKPIKVQTSGLLTIQTTDEYFFDLQYNSREILKKVNSFLEKVKEQVKEGKVIWDNSDEIFIHNIKIVIKENVEFKERFH